MNSNDEQLFAAIFTRLQAPVLAKKPFNETITLRNQETIFTALQSLYGKIPPKRLSNLNASLDDLASIDVKRQPRELPHFINLICLYIEVQQDGYQTDQKRRLTAKQRPLSHLPSAQGFIAFLRDKVEEAKQAQLQTEEAGCAILEKLTAQLKGDKQKQQDWASAEKLIARELHSEATKNAAKRRLTKKRKRPAAEEKKSKEKIALASPEQITQLLALQKQWTALCESDSSDSSDEDNDSSDEHQSVTKQPRRI